MINEEYCCKKQTVITAKISSTQEIATSSVNPLSMQASMKNEKLQELRTLEEENDM